MYLDRSSMMSDPVLRKTLSMVSDQSEEPILRVDQSEEPHSDRGHKVPTAHSAGADLGLISQSDASIQAT